MNDNCLFCKIASGAIPATIVAESEHAMAFRDINPKAPVHVLVIPRTHVDSMNAVTDASIVGEMALLARTVAQQEGIAENGWRAVINTGSDGGQTVFHLHMHMLGGRDMHWPPG